MLKSRVITAAILLALLLAALFALPPAAWAVLIVAMVMQGAVEWSHLSGLSGGKANIYRGLTLLLMLWLLWTDASATEAQHLHIHLAVYAASALLWLIVAPIWLMAAWKIRHPAFMVLTGWVVLIPTGLAMLDLRAASPWMLLFVMCLVWAADISAYFAGRKFGKHKLAPSISPGKTWEGVAGALLGVSVYVVLVLGFSPEFTYREALPILLLASWWWVGLAVIGDLFESAVKRQAGVKDSGALLPGHGGLLDRIDALTSTLPLAALALLLQKLG
ncbi:MAG: phosphatidate cytidylyltransferase [Nitrosomonadales bacterium]|nr:phosphatidate cytidylyltransferase [Nitrosomonadales bacterium]